MKKITKKDDSKKYYREEALKRASSILELANQNERKYEIAGSYRRGLEFVGDLDIVALKNDIYWWHWAVGSVGGIPWAMGDRNLDFSIDEFPINIRFFDGKEWGAGLLYFTGSKKFNIICREKAYEKGYLLNQYDLFDRETEAALNLGRKEAWILEKLGLMDYLSPASR